MDCPFGCIGGRGQNKLQNPQLIQNRALGLYYQDKLLPARNPADNQEIKNLYQNFLISPLSQKSKELLHTTYKKRE
jgi:iron only hydrogenase large subunit-like protein